MGGLRPHRIAVIYAIVGALWILGSDSIVGFVFSAAPPMAMLVSTLKGWGFVLVTAGLLSVLLNRHEAALARQQAATRESEERFRAIFNSVSDAVMVHRLPDGAFTDVNDRTCEMVGYSREEILRLDVGALSSGVPPYTQARAMELVQLAAQGLPQTAEWRVKARDGRLFWVEVTIQKVRLGDRDSVLVTCRDIDARKRAEAELQQSLAEKTILLKEVHHRVKNNLQIINSLLYLQMEHVVDARDRALFVESQNRIHAMALVHEEVYKSPDLASVDMQEYIPLLVRRLARSSPVPIALDLSVAPSSLPITKSLPCGLILNELVTNSIRHAFHGRDQGTVRVAFDKGPDTFRLEVSDDGPGIPETVRLDTPTTLGMTLIKSLADQLEGRINLSPGEGSRLTLSFPA